MYSSSKVINKLIKKNITISVVESCTGGLISSTLVKNDGVSKIFSSGLICYSNLSKIKYLSVSKKTLSKFGAVSSNIAEEMINKLYNKEKTIITISTTGIAGPKGGTKTKPVGLVYIGIKKKKIIKINRYVFKNLGRKYIQKATVNRALKLIHNFL